MSDGNKIYGRGDSATIFWNVQGVNHSLWLVIWINHRKGSCSVLQ